jgi:antitoxin Phd
MAVILKNNVPRYLVIEFSQAEAEQTMADEDIMSISKRLIAKNMTAYKELAK